jgi:SAM-dependent methyltransferase
MTKTKKNRIAPVLNGHVEAVAPPQLIKLDIGCGSNKREGFLGVDAIQFPGVDVVFDIRNAPWPWPDNSVEEANCSHVLEHLTNLDGKWERVRFFNELHRVLVPGGKCQIIIPHWCSMRYYGDPTHKEPFSEFGFYYLLREWRLGKDGSGANAPHADIQFNTNGYSCDFDAIWGYGVHPQIQLRNSEAQQFAFQWYKEAIQDLWATVTKRG